MLDLGDVVIGGWRSLGNQLLRREIVETIAVHKLWRRITLMSSRIVTRRENLLTHFLELVEKVLSLIFGEIKLFLNLVDLIINVGVKLLKELIFDIRVVLGHIKVVVLIRILYLLLHLWHRLLQMIIAHELVALHHGLLRVVALLLLVVHLHRVLRHLLWHAEIVVGYLADVEVRKLVDVVGGHVLHLLRIMTLLGRNLRRRRLPRVIFLMSSLCRALYETLDALMEITTVLLRRILLILTHGDLLHILRLCRHELLLHRVRSLLLILVLLLDWEVSEGILHLRLLVHIHESKLKSGQLV